jgi:hypothetical protein
VTLKLERREIGSPLMYGTPWSYGRRNWIQLRRGGKDQGSATSCANQSCSRPIIRSSRAFPTDGTYFRFTRRLDGCISVRATLWHGPGTGIVLLRAVSIHRVSQKVGRTVSTFLTGGSRRQLRAGLQIITRSQGPKYTNPGEFGGLVSTECTPDNALSAD